MSASSRMAARQVRDGSGGAVTAITLAARSAGTTDIAYAFDVDESVHAAVEEGVDDVLARVSEVLAEVG